MRQPLKARLLTVLAISALAATGCKGTPKNWCDYFETKTARIDELKTALRELWGRGRTDENCAKVKAAIPVVQELNQQAKAYVEKIKDTGHRVGVNCTEEFDHALPFGYKVYSKHCEEYKWVYDSGAIDYDAAQGMEKTSSELASRLQNLCAPGGAADSDADLEKAAGLADQASEDLKTVYGATVGGQCTGNLLARLLGKPASPAEGAIATRLENPAADAGPADADHDGGRKTEKPAGAAI